MMSVCVARQRVGRLFKRGDLVIPYRKTRSWSFQIAVAQEVGILFEIFFGEPAGLFDTASTLI